MSKNSYITLDEQRIIFKNINKKLIKDCLLEINKFIEERRSKYFKLKDYIYMYFIDMIKLIVFIGIGILVILIIYHG